MARLPKSGTAAEPDGADPIADFISDLRKLPGGDHVIRGMVKPAETDDGVMFAHAGDCETWVHIPASTMKAVRTVGHVGCDSHSHAVAEIQLKDPEDELARTFANLASLHRAALTRIQAVASGGSCTSNSDCGKNQHCGPDSNGGMKCLPGPF